MKVLMLSIDKTLLGEQVKDYYSPQGDTIERHCKYGELVDKLYIVVISQPGFEHLQLSEKVEVYPTNAKSVFGHFSSAVKFAESFLSHGGLDLIVAQDMAAPAAWLIKKKYNIPYIVSFHAAGFDTPEWRSKIKNRLVLPFVRQAVKKADGLRVVSHKVKNYFEKTGIKCPIKVIPTPVDLSIFTKDFSSQAAEIRNQYADSFIILTDGRLEIVKNYSLLLEAIKKITGDRGPASPRLDARLAASGQETGDRKKIENIKLLIIGSGLLEKKLKDKVKKLNIEENIVFLGSMPYHDLPQYYQACDLFVLSSNSESLGKVLLQAGAAQKPIVATRTLGASSIIKNGKTGYLVEIGNVKQLANKIIKLLKDDKLRQKMGAAAREYILKNYNSEENIKKLIKFWEEIAKL